MRPSRLLLAALFALVGLIWVGQGLGFIGGSFMTGAPVWAVIGAGLLLIAAAMVMLERRGR
jgi:hypothetical protein